MVNLLQRYLLTAKNISRSVLYVLKSLFRPIIGNFALQYQHILNVNFFYIVRAFLALILVALLLFKTK